MVALAAVPPGAQQGDAQSGSDATTPAPHASSGATRGGAGAGAPEATAAGPLSSPSLSLDATEALSIVAEALRRRSDDNALAAATHGVRRATLDGTRQHSRSARGGLPGTTPANARDGRRRAPSKPSTP